MNSELFESENMALYDENNLPERKGNMFKAFWEFFKSDEKRYPSKTPGPFSVDLVALNAPTNNELRIIWLGHSTTLIDIDGKRFLTDPMWSDRCSPVSFMGPRRFFNVPIPLEKLPPIDGVIISHDHYDHLDKATIKKLGTLTKAPFYLPMGVGDYLRNWGIPKNRIHEFRWWDEIKINEHHTLAMTPARHFSGRGILDRNKTLWASWAIIGPKHRVYFGGDSGMFPGFETIGKRYGPFDITMLEIGAFDDAWADIHLGPENALKAHALLQGRLMMPIHWGTFNLALHAWDEPVETLVKNSQKQGVELLLPRPGRVYESPNFTAVSYWWREDKSLQVNPEVLSFEVSK